MSIFHCRMKNQLHGANERARRKCVENVGALILGLTYHTILYHSVDSFKMRSLSLNLSRCEHKTAKYIIIIDLTTKYIKCSPPKMLIFIIIIHLKNFHASYGMVHFHKSVNKS